MTEPHPFDTATALTRSPGGSFTGNTSSAYANLIGPFGGTTAATLLRAVIEHDERSGDPVAMTVNFCSPVEDGSFTVSAKAERTGRHTQHWSLELTQGEAIRATAAVVCGTRSEVFAHDAQPMPEARDPEAYEVVSTEGLVPWLQRYEFRFVEGAPAFTQAPHPEPADSRSLWWVADRPARPLDYLSLASIADTFFLRLLHVRGTIGAMGTVSMTTYIHATPEELAEQGAAPLLGAAHAKRIGGRFHDQHMELWGADGKLLATGMQLVWYRE